LQLFRRECFQEIGGYVPNRAGGVDWIASMTARMKGWKVRSFPEKRFHHHRTLGTAERGPLRALFSYVENSITRRFTNLGFPRNISDGSGPAGRACLAAGYTWAALRRTTRAVTPELMHFHRREQMKKLRAIFRSLLSFKKVDSFRIPQAENSTHI
jgi:hypothetical protein